MCVYVTYFFPGSWACPLRTVEPNGRKRGADKEKLMDVMQKGRETTPRLIVLYA
jgi:hypothetical protein